MPPLENRELTIGILKTAVDIIGRRTSEIYAVVVVDRIIGELRKKYDFLKHITIKVAQYWESVETVNVEPDINKVDREELNKFLIEFFKKLTKTMDKSTGYYFIREIKENLPLNFEETLKKSGIDLDVLQLEYITELKILNKIKIENSEILRIVLKIIFDIIDIESDRRNAIQTLSHIVTRLRMEYDFLEHVEINDVIHMQGMDIISVSKNIDTVEQRKIGELIQRILHEANKSLKEKGGYRFIERIRNRLTEEYLIKLEEIGVNLEMVQLTHEALVKHVIKSLVDVLSEASAQSYAVLAVDTVLKKLDDRYGYLKYVKIDSTRYSEGINAISIPAGLNTIRSTEIGRAIQKILENITISLGDEAGQYFIERFSQRLGKIYLSRIEEMGVNLHMIQLKQNLLW
ncbi:MAG: hypothetical protein QHH19_05505 [Candidatus Thermoplasmatota archaeon]|jgi:hypothetical protein|nr:hypothetical protein [Candidatus Thermoplasmatota archaeon]